MITTLVLIIIATAIILYLLYRLNNYLSYENIAVLCSGSFLTHYKVLKNPDSIHAAKLLCRINSKLHHFKTYLQKKHPKNQHVRRFIRFYSHNDLVESLSTYTVNKSQNPTDKIYLCLRNPHTGKFYPDNDIMFAALHEITHVMHPNFHTSTNHPPEYWRLNSWVLKEAEKAGIYQITDYSVTPLKYCDDIIISANPALLNFPT